MFSPWRKDGNLRAELLGGNGEEATQVAERTFRSLTSVNTFLVMRYIVLKNFNKYGALHTPYR